MGDRPFAGLAWMVVGNAFALVLSHALLRAFRTGRGDLDLVAFLVLHLTVVSAVVLLAGLAGALAALPLGLACSGGLVALLATRQHVPLAGDLRALARACRLGPLDDPFARLARAAAIALAGALLATVGLHAWLLAPSWIDVTSYHVPKLAAWVHEGRIHTPPAIDTRAYWPAGFQLLQAWWTVFLHHDVLIELAGIETYLLAGVAVLAIARNLGLSRGGAAVAALLMLSVPAVVVSTPSASNDIAVAALVLAALALLHPLDVPGRRARLALATLVVVLGIGIKPTVGLAAPAFVVVGAWRFRLGERQAGGWLRAAVLAAGLALGLAWYARNAVLFGNPFFPTIVAGMPGIPTHYEHAEPRAAKLTEHLRALANERLYDRGPIEPWLGGVSGWGWVTLPCGLPALLLALRGSPEFRVIALAFVAGVVGVFSFVGPDTFNMRFILWFPGLVCVAVGALVEGPWPRAPRRAYVALVALGCGLNLVATVVPQHLTPRALRALVMRDWRHRSALDVVGRGPLPLPDAEPLAAVGSAHGHLYALYGPGYGRRVVHLQPTSVAELGGEMRSRGLRYVYVLEPRVLRLADGSFVDEEELVRDALATGQLRRVAPHLHALP